MRPLQHRFKSSALDRKNPISSPKGPDMTKSAQKPSTETPRHALVMSKHRALEILHGKRTWELRGTQLHKRGRFCIAARREHLIYGEVDFVNSIPVGRKVDDKWQPYNQEPKAKENFFMNPKNTTKHNDANFHRDYRIVHAWVLENPQAYKEPVLYKPIKGPLWQPLSEETCMATTQQRSSAEESSTDPNKSRPQTDKQKEARDSRPSSVSR
ncbi:unnamed protein product [Symbiodinium natans]|uniref:Uncharacterized protein n=1 Tax=Symbiodinium natans TaxID=878477 RepID=A0A812KV24_9DINO|nr:unnamed protein product [Symbiodinium natans]